MDSMVSPKQDNNVLTSQNQISATNTSVNSSESESSIKVFYVPRRFVPESKLHIYLAKKCPENISIRKFNYNLYEVTPN